MRVNWTSEEEKKLIELVNKNINQGIKGPTVFKNVSKELKNSTPNSCRVRYYILLNNGLKPTAIDKKKFNRDDNDLENKLIDIVTQTIKEGGSVVLGLKKASKVLGYSYFTCKSKWDNFKNVERSRKVVNWTSEEEEKLLSIILEKKKNGSTVKDACKITSKVLGRTINSCLGKWHNELKYFYQDEKCFEKNVWTQDELNFLRKAIKESKENNVMLKQCFIEVSKQLNKTVNSCKYHYRLISKKFILENNRWTKSEEEKLKEIMLREVGKGEKIGTIFEIVSKELNRSLSSIKGKWYAIKGDF